ncbi:MAG: CPBP family intramembrane glutamic endopeptidase [Bdellovibrionota bacterium]
MRTCIILCVILLFCVPQKPALAAKKDHAWAFGVASIIPGLGQALQGNVLEGLGWLSSTLVAWRFRIMPQKIIEYNMYDSYRDAGADDTSKENWFQNYTATFNPLNIIDPIGGPIAVGYGFIVSPMPGVGGPIYLRIPMYAMVGWGEEGLFRGFLYPAFSHLFDSRFLGAVASSALFGVAHYQYTWSNRFFLMGVGMLWSWQLTRNRYDLRKNIFSHSWVDIVSSLKANIELDPRNTADTKRQGAGIRFSLNYVFDL